jgi:tRNA-dihydrouridine synthase B
MSNPQHKLSSPLQIGSTRLANRIIGAPMSGVSDLPWRKRVVEHGAAASIAEMSAVERIISGRDRGGARRQSPAGHVSWVQIAGRDPTIMAEAARVCEAEGADLIDINFGCPAKKVTGGYAGSALMREPDLIARMVEAVADAVSVPVTAKMRLGWDETSMNAPQIATLAVSAGAQAITVHGRTRCQFYTGSADWAAVRAVRDAISVPLIINGDVTSAETAKAAIAASGAEAVMIGRACYGALWVPGLIAAELGDPKAGKGMPQAKNGLTDYVIAHHSEMLELYGANVGMRHARKHLGWYLDRFAPDCAPTLRTQILTAHDNRQLADLLVCAFAPKAVRAAA